MFSRLTDRQKKMIQTASTVVTTAICLGLVQALSRSDDKVVKYVTLLSGSISTLIGISSIDKNDTLLNNMLCIASMSSFIPAVAGSLTWMGRKNMLILAALLMLSPSQRKALPSPNITTDQRPATGAGAARYGSSALTP